MDPYNISRIFQGSVAVSHGFHNVLDIKTFSLIGNPKSLILTGKRKSVVESDGGEISTKDIAAGRAALRRVRSVDKDRVI